MNLDKLASLSMIALVLIINAIICVGLIISGVILFALTPNYILKAVCALAFTVLIFSAIRQAGIICEHL